MGTVDFDVFDADNHYYEATDAFIRHLPKGREKLVQWATIDGKRILYQEGALAAMRRPEELLELHGSTRLASGAAMFCGTVGAIGGIRPATRFEMELEDPVLRRRLAHAYEIVTLPVIA